jgi:probable rRNA maturation factor
LKIHIANRQKDLKLNKNSIRIFVQSALACLKISADEVALYFVSSKEISSLHNQFFQDPSPTDCISFPLDASHLGEIFVCPAVAIAYAEKKGLDPYAETALYIVHGLLHLLGYDDQESAQRRIMRKKEKSCMRHLCKLNVNLRPA